MMVTTQNESSTDQMDELMERLELAEQRAQRAVEMLDQERLEREKEKAERDKLVHQQATARLRERDALEKQNSSPLPLVGLTRKELTDKQKRRIVREYGYETLKSIPWE